MFPLFNLTYAVNLYISLFSERRKFISPSSLIIHFEYDKLNKAQNRQVY